MNNFQWFRSWHGAPTDHKWTVIASRAGVPVGAVSAIAWALMDHASQHDERGSIDGFDTEVYAVYSGFEEARVKAVIEAMTDKKLIIQGRLANWEKRQPKREDSSRDRMRKLRERRTVDGAGEKNTVTPSDAGTVTGVSDGTAHGDVDGDGTVEGTVEGTVGGAVVTQSDDGKTPQTDGETPQTVTHGDATRHKVTPGDGRVDKSRVDKSRVERAVRATARTPAERDEFGRFKKADKTPAKPTKKKTKAKKIDKGAMDAMVEAIAEVTASDLKMNYSRMAAEGAILIKAGYTADAVKKTYAAGGAWYRDDFRGRKGDYPSVGVIHQTIKQLLQGKDKQQTEPKGFDTLRRLANGEEQE